MFNKIRKSIREKRIERQIRQLESAQEAFKNGDFREVYRYLAKLARCSRREVERAFQVAGMLKRKTTYQLLREAMEPKLQS